MKPDRRAGRVASAGDAAQELRTVRDCLRWAVSRFAVAQIGTGHGTASLFDEAVAMALWSLHLPPDDLDRWLDARLARSEREALIALIERRCTERVPAAYLTGETWLRGVCFRSDARALVPRSLIAEALDSSLAAYLEAFQRPGDWPRRILDLCTGGGSLAVLCALRFPDAQICASDLSEPALALAAENINLHGLSTRIELLQGDLLAPHTGEPFDLIVCNPPYVCDASMALLPQEFRAEPRIALAGGPDGMQLVARILSEAAQHLTENGLLVLEIGHEAAHFERAFPRLEFAYLPVEAGEQMVVAIDAQALRALSPRGRTTRRTRAVSAARQPGRRSAA